MKKKNIAYLVIALMMLLSVTVPSIPVLASSYLSSLTIEMYNSNKALETNTISPTFKIKNSSDSCLNLKDVTVRYYYTSDGNQEQNFWCDHAGALLGYNYVDNTSKVTGKFIKEPNSTPNYDTYLEIGFADGASTLAPNEEISIQTRITKADWSNYNQSNDYSFDPISSVPTTNDKIVVCISGIRVWGPPPISPILPPSISPTTASFDKNVTQQADIKVMLTLNNTSLKSISNGTQVLIAGTDFNVSGNYVTISKNYLAKQPFGTTILTFSFSDGTNSNLNIYSVHPDIILNVKVGTATGTCGSNVSVPITFLNVSTYNKLAVCELSVSFDSNMLEVSSITAGDIVTNPAQNLSYTVSGNTIRFAFLDDTLGEQLISHDGTFANINFKIKGTPSVSTSPLQIPLGVFADGQLNEVPFNIQNGYVRINATA
ncbi:X2-like carbohydrate binding domain-containing protein [Clostridium cellulovorans]|uniref:Cellulosome anchoring protein cohesin region n=2 Tax=Clostridium cellulovorans TaxID=1493 RepID=D9SV33_CLOC7|nr:X2-like carbohydrate binding domain-containing protein [Clostridium cellulovorans]ADL53007.1 cellulosome anchoring protein cohesin region [Clostridium cellulovorans 743B]BAV13062.1 cellulose binding protein [Clostridium cellulovorans]